MTNLWAFQIARSIFESDIRIQKPSRWLKVWIYIIWNVNHTDWKQLQRWQWWFTYDKIYIDCNLVDEWVKKSAIDNVIRRMKKEWNLTTHKTTRGFIITVIKYNDYQTFDNYKTTRKMKTKRNPNDTITKEWKEWNNIIISWTSNQEIDESIKTQIKEIIPLEVLKTEKEKYYCLLELVALWLKTEKTEKWIQSRIYDIEKKLEANKYYTNTTDWKEYDRERAYKVSQTCRTWNEAQEKECWNPLNSFNKFLSTNK